MPTRERLVDTRIWTIWSILPSSHENRHMLLARASDPII
jgi:hypothetical protein